LRSFCIDVRGCDLSSWRPAEQYSLVNQIKSAAAGRKVFFFVSGGVDSTVAFVLCLRSVKDSTCSSS
jgi:GMP synthase (glutamine-hydrolysing)